MPGLANVFFRDCFATLDGGFYSTSFASGVNSGGVIQLGGKSPVGKLLFRFLGVGQSAATSVSMYLMSASASNGQFTSISQTLTSVAIASTSAAASVYQLVLDTRNEAFGNLAAGGSAAALWVKPVVSITGATMTGWLDVLGWSSDILPAKYFDAATASVTEVDFY